MQQLNNSFLLEIQVFWIGLNSILWTPTTCVFRLHLNLASYLQMLHLKGFDTVFCKLSMLLLQNDLCVAYFLTLQILHLGDNVEFSWLPDSTWCLGSNFLSPTTLCLMYVLSNTTKSLMTMRQQFSCLVGIWKSKTKKMKLKLHKPFLCY